jgi:hypothetical protein
MIVDAVQHEQVPHVSPREQNGVAVTVQPEAPVQGDGVTGNGGKCTVKTARCWPT